MTITRRQLTVGLSVFVGAVAILCVTFGMIAKAHIPNVQPSCSGLSVNMTSYEGPKSNNTATITIDGHQTVVDFATQYKPDPFMWSQTSSHTWSVVVDANKQVDPARDEPHDGVPDYKQYDSNQSGVQQPCQTTTSSTVPVASSSSTSVVGSSTTSTVAQPTTTSLPPAASTSTSTSTPPSAAPTTSSTPATSAPSAAPTTTASTPPSTPAAPGAPATSTASTPNTVVQCTKADGQPCDLPATGVYLMFGILVASCALVGGVALLVGRRQPVKP